ncbi:MAG: hypothetical protein IGS50_17920 [Synechococcales cyanobacterium C42_A2020_086]|jgi:hypothetical protein|nr:hypothetical protein [Synechococcales cyanobacterium C42_A2020_086]
MKLATSFVTLSKIRPTVSRWNFSATDLEAAARLVLEADGLINPIVICREDDLNSYVVLHGNFEYYAVATAYQMDHRCGDAIAAFIIEPGDRAIIQQQIELFRGSRISTPAPAGATGDYSDAYPPAIQDLKQQIEVLRAQLYSTHALLDWFNHAESDYLLHRLKRIGMTSRNVEKVVELIEQERQRKPFRFLKEVVLRVKGLTYEKMIDLVETL